MAKVKHSALDECQGPARICGGDGLMNDLCPNLAATRHSHSDPPQWTTNGQCVQCLVAENARLGSEVAWWQRDYKTLDELYRALTAQLAEATQEVATLREAAIFHAQGKLRQGVVDQLLEERDTLSMQVATLRELVALGGKASEQLREALTQSATFRELLEKGVELSLSNQRAATMRHALVAWGEQVGAALAVDAREEQ